MRTSTQATLVASLAIVAAHLAGPASAQEAWPSKRLTMVVGFAAGGFADSVGRIVARKLGERLKHPVVVQNIDGAGGNIAARNVSMAPADGYTILVTTTSLAINETLAKDKGFTADTLVPVAIPVEAPEMLVGNPKHNIRSLADAMEHAKTGKLYFGSSGVGSGSHIAVEYFFKVLAKVEAKHIPFKGGHPAMHALLTGDVNLLASTATAKPHIRSGELAGLAVASDARDPSIPDVPTYAELGYKGFKASSWVGVFAPAGTPDAVVERLNTEINAALAEPDVQRQLEQMGLLASTRSAQETAALFKSDVARWREMVQAIGLLMN
ncbi:MAG TPA: tripartite tricarboxylate transporter substrate-binding protein [Beijerinckiaceae bacterium]|jgi:tripartite-type tricarboxylate transporter receptor subunit TctC